MARMYPETLRGAEVRSNAERVLFEAFRERLSDNFTVLHSVAWLGIRQPGSEPVDGEADFVVMHPRMAVLVIEVKGGIVGFDANDGWFSVRRDGTRVSIKDPFAQARRSKYALIRKIRSLPNWQGAIPTIGHAVAFPDGVTELKELAPDAPRDIVIFHADLTSLEKRVRDCMKFWAGETFSPPGEGGVEALVRLLRKSWLIREPRLGEEIDIETTAIEKYTAEQFRVLDILAGRPRAATRGCAGSGKTMLAVEKARRLASEGFRTLLTCYNRKLADELAKQVGDIPRLKVSSFHALCREYAASTGRDERPDWDAERRDFFDAVMPDALAEAASAGDDTYFFDAIVVDEGQDFMDSWWVALQMVLRDPENGVLYVFYDDNQLVYRRPMSIPVEELPFTLTVNCRNTRHIHNVVSLFYRSDTISAHSCAGPVGRPPEVHTYKPKPSDLRAVLTEVLTRLVFAEKVDNRDIVILSPGGPGRPPLAGIGEAGAFALTGEGASGAYEIFCTTIRRFKGLERPVVILILPAEMDRSEELAYVGVSRARNHLVLLIASDAPPELADRVMSLIISNEKVPEEA